MSRLTVKCLESLAELRDAASAWDELWQRSEIALPTARAELIAVWSECFAASRPLRAFVVEQDGRWVAALPLLEGRCFGLPTGTLPGNHWSPAGDLLLDPHVEADRVLQPLLDAVTTCWPLARFNAVPIQSSRWQAWLGSLAARQLTFARRHCCSVNGIRIESDWQSYLKTRSRKHRRYLRRAVSHAEQQGATKLVCHDDLDPEAAVPLLQTCWQIEARGWKGAAGGAVLNVPGACDFYLRQARQLAAWGQLSLVVLEHQGQPIAFEYGWRGKGVYFSPKVGYDEEFAQLSPGQLLRYRLFERLHNDPQVTSVDFLGPSSDATSKWATYDYPVERILVALRGSPARALVAVCKQFGPLVRRLRALFTDSESTVAPAAGNRSSVVPSVERDTEPVLAE